MLIDISHRQRLTNAARRLDENWAKGVEAVGTGVMDAASVLRESLEAADIEISSGKLEDTSRVDIDGLAKAIEAFADTVRAIEGNYQQAQQSTLERILKIHF